jgi:hypothetical protein
LEEQFEFRPMHGVQTVLWMIFMPFIELFHHCGIPCCGEMRPLRENQYEGDNDDEERQLRPNLTMTTVSDVDGSSEE